MSVINGTVEAKTTKGKGGALLIDGEWYGAFSPSQIGSADKGDQVTFEWSKNGNFRNIKGDVQIDKKGSPSATTRAPVSKGHSSAGVEVGHAWNSAVQIVLAAGHSDAHNDIDSFLVECGQVAAKVYAVCGELRRQAEAGELRPGPLLPKSREVAITPTAVDISDSIDF